MWAAPYYDDDPSAGTPGVRTRCSHFPGWTLPSAPADPPQGSPPGYRDGLHGVRHPWVSPIGSHRETESSQGLLLYQSPDWKEIHSVSTAAGIHSRCQLPRHQVPQYICCQGQWERWREGQATCYAKLGLKIFILLTLFGLGIIPSFPL